MSSERKAHQPAVDERLIMPETRYEIVDGELVYVSPALEPHASRHSKLSAILEAYAAEGYNAASDMLTRTTETSDFAPDGSIYPVDRDPETGGRQLEELAFEVVSTETLAHAAKKAAGLNARGVRRVFALDVERKRALEWSAKTGAWEILPTDGTIDDGALVAPLPIRDLVDAANTDDAVARALLAKNNPVIAQAVDGGRAEGKAEAVLAVLEARGIRVAGHARARIADCRDQRVLDTWLQRAATVTTLDDLFA